MPLRSLLLLALALPLAVADARAEDPRSVAFFGFELINTSLEPTSEAESERIRMLNARIREKLEGSGRYRFVALSPELQAQIADAPEIRNCNGCELGFAQAAGAQLAAWGTVQKVSNLILNINLYMRDVASGDPYFVRSVDIRGNTDESWRHGLDYMLRNYLLKQP